MLDEIDSLLSQSSDTATTIQGLRLKESPGVGATSGIGEPTEPAHTEDDQFGPYTIVRLIGEGGMGTVYLVEQTRPIRRQVALKVVKLGMDTRQVIARFESERQALAMMEHPHIAQIYDAGTSEKGRPYFVMEYVPGVAITQYCDQHLLDTRERLKMFVTVCEALQHAHQKGVIHRDIKPSNILVFKQDGKPFPKVIDFGIAKATDQRAAEQSAFTQMGSLVGTPEYMSPEQANLTNPNVDTATDVYSLGVLLYELLAGALPFEGKSLRQAGLAELLRIIREEVPPTPSDRITQLGEIATEVARCRRTNPPTLRRELAGDLNWIVMKALEKDRSRRYASMSEFAADVERHLGDQPVLAGPPGALYRARKFARRHRIGVATGLLVAASLVAGMISTGWEAHVAEARRREAETQRHHADAEAQAARESRAAADRSAGEAKRNAQIAEARRREAEVQRKHADADAKAARESRAAADRSAREAKQNEALARDAERQTRDSLTNLERAQRDLQESFAVQQRLTREARARELTAEAALSQTRDPALALYLGWQAAQMGRSLPTGLDAVLMAAAANGPSYGTLQNNDVGVADVAWSPDGKTLASVGDGMIRLWEAATGQPLRTLHGQHASVRCVAWSPDGKTLASPNVDNTIQLWDPSSGQPMRTLQGHESFAFRVAWSPDSKTLASASRDETVRLWDVATGQPLRTLHRQDPVFDVAWSPDAKTLASAAGLEIWLVETATGRFLRTFRPPDRDLMSGLGGLLTGVAWSPDGKTLASAGGWTIRLWELASGQPLRTLQDTQSLSRVVWSPDGKTLASTGLDQTVQLWDAATGRPLRTLKGHRASVTSVAWSPDGKTLASTSNDHTIRLWEVASDQLLSPLQGLQEAAGTIAWSPDGTTLASAGNSDAIHLWEAASGQRLHTLQGMNSVAWSPNGKTLASGDIGGNIRLWEAASGQLLRTLQGHEGAEITLRGHDFHVAWSPDGSTLAAACIGVGTKGTVRLWRAANGQLMRTLQSGQGFVRGVAWSPDGRTLAWVDGSGTIQLSEAASGQPLRTLRGAVNSVAWSPDGKTLASAGSDATVRLWEVANGQTIRTLQGHEASVNSVAWSPDGKILASASQDRTIRLWEAASGQPLRTLQGHQASVVSVAWSPDGKTLASASADRTIRLWPATFDALLEKVRHSIRLFSPSTAECQRYFESDSCPPIP